jgi:uncharacterized protein (DUF488 family)
MVSRQRAILRLIQNDSGAVSRLRLVKLAFLLSREDGTPRAGIYDFVPYKRGPFSFTLYHELRVLERDGWITQAGNDLETVTLPDLETACLDKGFLAQIDSVSRRQRQVTTTAMVDAVYRDYPWFTMNSEVTHKRAARRPIALPAVYTVGYEGITVDALLDILIRQGILRLIDVRSNPIARRYGFHRSTLEKLCSDVGIEYVHYPELGVPSPWRSDLSNPGAHEQLFERYDKEILPRHRDAVRAVSRLVADSPSALMCMEANHLCCHRSRLGIEVSRLTSLPIAELREL